MYCEYSMAPMSASPWATYTAAAFDSNRLRTLGLSSWSLGHAASIMNCASASGLPVTIAAVAISRNVLGVLRTPMIDSRLWNLGSHRSA